MAKVPVITSACPIRFQGAPQPGKDFCGQCRRRVHNLDGMSDSERQTFFAACSGDVCVSYSVKRAVKIAAVGLATMGVATGVAALADDSADEPKGEYCDVITMGGVTASKDLQWVDESEAALPENPELPEIAVSEWLPAPK
jgi:hypothetical protein